MSEIACRLCVQHLVFYAEGIQQLRQDDATDRIDGIDTNLEMGILDGFNIYQLQTKDILYMPVVSLITVDVMTKCIDVGIFKVCLFGDVQHLRTIGSSQKLSFAVQQFQRIPLTRIVTCRYDDAAIGTQRAYRQLSRRRRSQSDVDDIVTHSHECAADHIIDHHTRDAGVAPHDNRRTMVVKSSLLTMTAIATDKRSIGGSKLHDVKWI